MMPWAPSDFMWEPWPMYLFITLAIAYVAFYISQERKK